MEFPIRALERSEFPPLLFEIPQVPEKLFLRGKLPPPHLTCLAVVGSREYTNYGKQVVEHLVRGLTGYPIAIISGLALGIDGLAHNAALEAGLYTLAVPGSGLLEKVLYPRSHSSLAERILHEGGGLLSEYEPDFQATTWSFPQRNRIMAGMSHATLVIEAGDRSGTLITARLTVEYNRELMVVPGNIFSDHSRGPHQFLKLGATPVTSSEDILEACGIEKDTNILRENRTTENLSTHAQTILALLAEPTDCDTLIRKMEVAAHEVSTTLMQLELDGHIRESNGVFYRTTQ